jgi:DNA repair photolyase
MNYKYVKYSNILNKITNRDMLFVGNYTLDPYQNCEFRCRYCDSSFDDTILIKSNTLKLLEKEIKNIKKGTIIVGSVTDPYQKLEEKQKITRNILEIIKNNNFSVHILTKSDLVLRDIDILSEIYGCIVTISIISLKKNVLNIFEKNVPSSIERLNIVKQLTNSGIKSGIAVLPLLPFIVEDELEEIIKLAKENGAQYLLHKHLELKGDQKTIFLKNLKELDHNLLNKYNKLYYNSYMPNQDYIIKIKDIVTNYCKKWNISTNI